MMEQSNRIATLLSWCSTNNIEIDKRLHVVPDATGLAMYSGETSIGTLQTIVKIPKAAVLSVKSCSASHFIENSPYGIEAQCALALALLIEMERGTGSRWHGYLQSLPHNIINLPVFWGLEVEGRTLEDGKEALKWLRGTEVEKLLVGSDGTPLIDTLHRYYDEIVTPTVDRLSSEYHLSPHPTFHHFCRAYSLVSSRAFLVDAYHGLSMVPIADAFNHTYDHHVHLETEYEVCPECGSLQQCPHDRDIELASSHSTTITSLDPVELDDTYDMVSNADIPAHSEIFNTYGETLSNAQLLAQYGFILDVNENDCISWNLDDLVNLLETDSRSRDPSTPLGLPWDILVKAFNTDVFSESELIFIPPGATFCINCEGKVSWQLWLAVAGHKSARLVPAERILLVLSDLGRYQTLRETEEDTDINDTHNYLLPSLARETASDIVKLCRQRRICLGSGRDQESLGNLVDELNASQSRTKLALLQTITELSILHSCEAVWQNRE
ncbi:hypothetical protein J3R30DRAFT_2137620 [Lentinula aciculospora]|uniref:SET domain-containing protein n=1 Tax=Lentinula aciculospora TaxID=153920 RepID=A0A9W9AJS1_9AGAR|nr:hypothetical protein J3R30DRAFT_2137620 [Lentinula aciculospora]